MMTHYSNLFVTTFRRHVLLNTNIHLKVIRMEYHTLLGVQMIIISLLVARTIVLIFGFGMSM